MKLSKKRYLLGFISITIFLALVRCVFPSVSEPKGTYATNNNIDYNNPDEADTIISNNNIQITKFDTTHSRFFKADGSLVKNRIYSVQKYYEAFPDQNDVQLIVAQKYGVKPVTNRNDAEKRMKELVYIGSNPFFYLDKLNSSIPYLVPRASVLLQDIGRNYYDSLQIKGIPLHKIIVTSVLRSKEDVNKLRGHNLNATENSCHLYGTTFDICYNRYKRVQDPNAPIHRTVTNDTLKWVLSEVLNDMRKNDRCYIKYEVKQGCFHITVK